MHEALSSNFITITKRNRVRLARCKKTPVARKEISDKDISKDEILFFSMSNM
jgi:hypothetical protein